MILDVGTKRMAVTAYQRLLIILLAAGICLIQASSCFSAPGSTGVSFLTFGVGARAAAMANAQVAVATDATALFWNPSGLAEIEGGEITVSHANWLEGIRYGSAGLAMDFGKTALGLGVQFLYLADELEKRDESGNLAGEFGYYDLAYSVSLARKFQGGLSLGLTYKRITEMIDNNYARGEALDAGARLPTPIPGVVIAGSIQNIGRNMTFKSEDFELPRTLIGGIGVKRNVFGGTLVLGWDLRRPKGEDYKVHTGAEFTLLKALSIAAGYKQGYDNENVSFGIGYSASSMQMNYSFTPFYSDLGNVQRISLSKSF